MDDAYKTEFLEIYDEHVKREGADRLREYLTDKSDFFVAPASARYHCAHEGGLCEHSVNAYKASARGSARGIRRGMGKAVLARDRGGVRLAARRVQVQFL